MSTNFFDPSDDSNSEDDSDSEDEVACLANLLYRIGETETPFDEWLKNNLPSSVKKDQGFAWIAVMNKSNASADHDDEKDFDGLFDEWEKHLELDKPVDYKTIKQLALQYKILSGKWLLWCSQGGKVDHLWSLIATSVVNNDIQCFSAKVSAHDDDETSHVICIYNTDFTNVDEVLDAEKAIRLMGIKGKLLYKPDIYTHLGIYSGNEWRLKPNILSSNFSLSTRSSIIEKFVEL